MSQELVNSLEHATEAGAGMFAGRADAVVGPARAEVRRARRMRAIGAGAVAAVLVGLAAVGVAWAGDDGGAIAPASPSADAPTPRPVATITRDQLLDDAAQRLRTVPSEPERQAAARCAGPWPESDTIAVLEECDAVWVGTGPLIDAAAVVTVDAAQSRLTVTWTITNVSDSALSIDRHGVAVALVTRPGGVGTGVGYGYQAAWGSSLWGRDDTRNVVLGGVSSPMTLGPHVPLSGVSTFTVSEDDAAGTAAIAQVAARTATTSITLQVRALPSGPLAGDELVLEATAGPTEAHPAVAEGDPGVTVPAEQIRAIYDTPQDAARGLVCNLKDDLNDSLQHVAPTDGVLAVCRTVWLPDRPALSGTVAGGSDGTYAWALENTSGTSVELDRGSISLGVDLAGPDGPVGVAWHGIGGGDGMLMAETLWKTNASRYVTWQLDDDLVTLEPGDTLEGSVRRSGPAMTDESSQEHVNLTVRYPARDDPEAGTVMLLEVPLGHTESSG